MDRSGPWGDSPAIQSILDGTVQVWHTHRIPLLMLTFATLVLLRIYLHQKTEIDELRVFPKLYETAKSVSEKQQDEKVIAQDRKEEKKSKTNGPKRIKGEAPKSTRRGSNNSSDPRQLQVLVFFSSLTGTTEKIAKDYAQKLDAALHDRDFYSASGEHRFLPSLILDLAEVDYDEYFIAPPKLTGEDGVSPSLFYLFLVPSYNIDTINDNFLEHLKETHFDFRIDTAPLSTILGYSVFGLGDKEGWPTEEGGFCFQAKEVDKWMAKLTGGKRAYPVGMADRKTEVSQRLEEWHQGLLDVMASAARTGSLGEGVPGSGQSVESDDEDKDYDDGEVLFEEDSQAKKSASKSGGDLNDLEDLGGMMQSAVSAKKEREGKKGAPIAVDFTTYGKTKPRKEAIVTVKEMVPKNSPTYASLTKQGYAIVGSHSGVKICRWTKSALRGRGSCYKFSFYGINSHQCMETTPSLSCSNKCVFCWRHGTNPVGTTWRWVVDPPELIFEGVKENHYKKIKMMRGVPGVRAERFAEGMRIRHCALSLVGEPIFYPYINEFLGMLHGDRISSFLVCNAQHPDQLAALKHVTQLYVSIDASNKDSLRKIDRPLHRDFWERFQRCLDILREKRFRQRTVFRLTLVKGFNIEEEVEGYAKLVEKALPCFVEIKGVTYCGTSTAGNAGLTMANVPFYEEVCEFVTSLEKKLLEKGLNYGIAAEHAHSCCILMASDRFKVDGKWHTLIDYEKFFNLLEEHGPDGDFSPEDYMGAETAEWATWGRGGFDPRDQRVDRKGRPIEI